MTSSVINPFDALARRSSPLSWALALLLLAVGMYITMRSVGWFSYVPGDLGDPRFNSAVLEHLFSVVTRGAPLWDVDFYYPFSGVLGFSDNHFGSGATYVAARLVGLSREHAFDVWYVAGVVANVAAAFYALRRFGLDPTGAAVGAFIFTWGMPILAQDGHAQLIYRFGVPLAALALWETFERRNILGLAVVALWTAWQFFCSIYVGIFLLYLLAAMAFALWLLNRPFDLGAWLINWRSTALRQRLIFAAVMLLIGVAMAWLLGNYLVVSRRYGLGRPIEEITSMLPRWASYFNMQRVHYLAGLVRHLSIPVLHEQQMFIGFAAMSMVFVGAIAALTRRATELSRIGVVAFWTLLLLVVGTLWIRYFSFYYLIAWIPGISSVRAVARVIVVMLLPMGLLAGIGVTVISTRLVRWKVAGPLIAVALVLLLCVEPYSLGRGSTSIDEWRQRVEAVRARLPVSMPEDAILFVRTDATDIGELIRSNLDAVILAQDLGIPTLNGYSGYEPPGRNLRDSCDTPQQSLESYGDFTGTDIAPLATRVVVVDMPPACPAAP